MCPEYCEDEALFFEERFESCVDYDLALDSAPVVEDIVVVTIVQEVVERGGWFVLTGRQWMLPPARAPPVFRH